MQMPGGGGLGSPEGVSGADARGGIPAQRERQAEEPQPLGEMGSDEATEPGSEDPALEEEEGRGGVGKEGSRPRRARHILECSKLEVPSDLEGGGRGWGGRNKYLWSTSCVPGAKQPGLGPCRPRVG